MTFSSQTVSLRKAGQILGKSNPFMQKLAAKGYLRTVKVGERFLVHLSEVERFQREGNYVEKGNSNAQSDSDQEAQAQGSEGNGVNEVNEADGTSTGIRPIHPDEIKKPNQKGGYSLEEAEGYGVPGEAGNRKGSGDNRPSVQSSDVSTSGDGQGSSLSGATPAGEARSSQASAPVVDEPYPAYLKEIIKRGAV